MPNQKRPLLVCVSDVEVCSTISAAAGECLTDVRFLSRQSLGEVPVGTSTDCVIVQFAGLSPEVCDFIDNCRRLFQETPIVAVLPAAALATDAGRFIHFGVFECLA